MFSFQVKKKNKQGNPEPCNKRNKVTINKEMLHNKKHNNDDEKKTLGKRITVRQREDTQLSSGPKDKIQLPVL